MNADAWIADIRTKSHIMLSTPDERPTRASGTNSKITPTIGIKFVTKAQKLIKTVYFMPRKLIMKKAHTPTKIEEKNVEKTKLSRLWYSSEKNFSPVERIERG